MLKDALVLVTSLCLAATVSAQAEVNTAFAALKLLPKDAPGRLARIEARDGQPQPERWHLIVHDPKEENGVHEYVVAGGELVASRSVSQFADTLTAADVIGADALKIDSDRALSVAEAYASANGLQIATANLELSREEAETAPIWRVTCLNAAAKPLGTLILTATKGTVISHDGFTLPPKEKKAATPVPRKEKTEPVPPKKTASRRDKERPLAPPAPDRTEPSQERNRPPAELPVARAEPVRDQGQDEDEEMDEEGAEAAEAAEDAANRDRPSWFRRTGGKIQKIFTGREAPGR